MKQGCEALVKAIDAYIAKMDKNFAESLDDAGFVDATETVKEVSTIEDLVAAALVTETAYFMQKLGEAADLKTFAEKMWPGIKDADAVADELYKIFFGEFQKFMPTLVSDYIMQTDADLVVGQVSKRTMDWVGQWSRELADLMKLESHNQIEDLLSKALENGDGPEELARAIQDSGIRNEYYRARKVSITETLRAHSVAAQEAMMQSPAVEEKEWKHTGSYRNSPRRNHEAMSGQRVPKGEPFSLDGEDGHTYYPMYPRDPGRPPGESINCHCISQPIVSKEVLGLSIEERRQLQAEAIDAMGGV